MKWNNKTSFWTVRECVLKYIKLMNENDMWETEIRFRGRARVRARNWNKMQNKSTCHTNIEQAVLLGLGSAACAEVNLLQWQFYYSEQFWRKLFWKTLYLQCRSTTECRTAKLSASLKSMRFGPRMGVMWWGPSAYPHGVIFITAI